MIDGIAYLNSSSVPTQDKCDDICSCNDGEVSCIKKENCVSEEDEDIDVTTLAPEEDLEEIPEVPSTTLKPNEGEEEYQEVEVDVIPDQTESDSEVTTILPDISVDEVPEEGSGVEEIEEEAEFTTEPPMEEEMIGVEEEIDAEEATESEEVTESEETPETTVASVEEDIETPDTTMAPSEIETDEDIEELIETTMTPEVEEEESEDIDEVDETEEVTTAHTEVDETDETTDEAEEDEMTTVLSVDEMSEDSDTTEPQMEGDDFEDNKESEYVTTLAPEVSSEEAVTMLTETESDQTDDSIDEDLEMTTVPFEDEMEPSEESEEEMETTESPTDMSEVSEADEIVTTMEPEIVQPVTTMAPVEGEEAVTTLSPISEETSEEEVATTLSPVPEETSEEEIMTTTAASIDESEPMTTTEPQLPVTEQPEKEIPTTTVEEVEEIIPTTTAAPVKEEIDPTSCEVDSVRYFDGDVVPSNNPCEYCQCFSGQSLCSVRECPPAPAGCDALPLKEGQCCPEYSCPVAPPLDDDEILDDDDDVPDEDISQKIASVIEETKPLPEDISQNITSEKEDVIVDVPEDKVSSESEDEIIEEKPVPLASVVSEAPTYSPDFNIDEVEKSTADPMIGTGSSAVLDSFSTTAAPIDEYDSYSEYEDELTLDSIGPGACLFEGKVYVSAQQIPRTNPCDFCFCFRGDIICLQQSCPPPIPGCREEAISGFCCPRYECPVKGGVQNVTVPMPSQPSISSWLFGSDQEPDKPGEITQQISGCEVQGHFYEVGAIVESSSGPCLQCR